MVTQWDGNDEAEGEIEPTPENDILSLVNQDRPKGTVVAIEDESIEFLLRKERAIRVPVERVKQIQFNSGKEIPSPPLAEPKTIRAHFAGGGSLSFDLISLDQDQLHGQSSTFGPMSFRSDSIRQIEFNLNHQALQKDEAADAIWNLQSKP